jgi:bile acid:Na+ symporter, BASS family
MKMTGGNPAATLVHIIHRYFIFAIVFSYVAAALLPQFGLWIRCVGLGTFLAQQGKMNLTLPTLMLATLLFNAGLGMPLNELREMPRKAHDAGRSFRKHGRTAGYDRCR